MPPVWDPQTVDLTTRLNKSGVTVKVTGEFHCQRTVVVENQQDFTHDLRALKLCRDDANVGERQAVIQLLYRNCKNFKVLLGEIVGAAGVDPEYRPLVEGQHGIAVTMSKGWVIAGGKISQTSGDGIYLANNAEDGVVQFVEFRSLGRNGVCIVGAINCAIDDNMIVNAARHALHVEKMGGPKDPPPAVNCHARRNVNAKGLPVPVPKVLL